MTNVSLYDPLSTRLSKIFNHLFWHPTLFNQQEDTQSFPFKLDVCEDDKNYFVRADLPGVAKEDIRVDVDDNQVYIYAEVKKSQEEKVEKNVICSERYEGKVFRSFTLDRNIDESRAEAKYVDGVLTLTLPKKSDGKNSKHLAVQ